MGERRSERTCSICLLDCILHLRLLACVSRLVQHLSSISPGLSVARVCFACSCSRVCARVLRRNSHFSSYQFFSSVFRIISKHIYSTHGCCILVSGDFMFHISSFFESTFRNFCRITFHVLFVSQLHVICHVHISPHVPYWFCWVNLRLSWNVHTSCFFVDISAHAIHSHILLQKYVSQINMICLLESDIGINAVTGLCLATLE